MNIIHGMHSGQQKKEYVYDTGEYLCFAMEWQRSYIQSKRETTDCPNILTINNQMIERSSRCQIDRLIEIATQPDTICHLLIIKMTTDNVFLSAANYSMLMFSTTIWRRLHSYTLLLRHRGHEQYALVAQWLRYIRPNLAQLGHSAQSPFLGRPSWAKNGPDGPEMAHVR